MHLSDILTHLGENRQQYFRAIAPPVIQSSNFAFDDLQHFRQSFSDELENHVYSRGNNPTVAILRQKLAALEATEDALVLSSGSAAVAAAVIANVQAGDHVVCVEAPYSWTHFLLVNFLSRFGVSHTFVDGCDLQEIESAIQPNTRILYLESPNSITFELQDLEACGRLARQHGLVSIIDNSYCSPIFQQPALYGIDIVVHSGSKYLNGHSDVVVGAICGSKEMIRKIFQSELMTLGAIIGPHDAALVIRGLRTLELRLQRSFESVQKITKWLAGHPKVEQVFYPFAPDFPQLKLAKRQMKGTGGLFSVLLKAERMEQVEAFVHQLRYFLMAVSWGGHESLILPFCGFYHIKGREDSSRSWRLVRFYIGLEEAEWLLADLKQALEVL